MGALSASDRRAHVAACSPAEASPAGSAGSGEAGVGVAADPQRFLKPGDEVAIEISGIGMLRNPVVAEA